MTKPPDHDLVVGRAVVDHGSVRRRMAKNTPSFNRFGMWRGETMALSRFLNQHTEINELYWSFVPVAGYGDYLARHAVSPIATSALFHASGPDVRRLEPSTETWRKQFKEFQNWCGCPP